MPLWKPLALIVPAGLVLGMIGGQLAKPVIVERAPDLPWQSRFQSRAEPNAGSSDYSAQPQNDLAYVGGYSSPPGFAVQDAGWTPRVDERLPYSDVSLPTVVQLDARQAALLADPDIEYAVQRPDEEAGTETFPEGDPGRAGAPLAHLASAAPDEAGSEPRKADGEPAIW